MAFSGLTLLRRLLCKRHTRISDPIMRDQPTGAANAAPSLSRQYRTFVFKRIFWLSIFLIALITSFIVNVITGPAILSFWDVVGGIIDPDSLSGAMQVIVFDVRLPFAVLAVIIGATLGLRSEEHTSELQSHHDLVCRLLLETKNKKKKTKKKLPQQTNVRPT